MGLDNPTHIAALAVVLLLVFGAKRLPEIGKSLGSSLREFKGAISGEVHPSAATLTPPAAPAAHDVPAAQPQWQPVSQAMQRPEQAPDAGSSAHAAAPGA